MDSTAVFGTDLTQRTPRNMVPVPVFDNRSHANGEHAMYNLNVPRVLYIELPTIFKLTGALLNVILIIYFIKSKRYLNPIFTILTSLAFIDFCVCFGGAGYSGFIFPIMTLPQYPFLCQIILCITPFGEMGSAYHLLFFAALRLYQVARPLKARALVTPSLMAKICLCMNIVIAACQIAYGLHWWNETTVVNGEEVTICAFHGDSKKKDFAFMIFGTAIPCPSIFLLHLSKYFVFRMAKNSIAVQQERKNPDARVVVLVIALFYITWIPAFTFMVIQHFSIEGYENTDDSLFLVLLHVMHSNSIMNPIVYVLALKSVREDFLGICFKSHRKKK